MDLGRRGHRVIRLELKGYEGLSIKIEIDSPIKTKQANSRVLRLEPDEAWHRPFRCLRV